MASQVVQLGPWAGVFLHLTLLQLVILYRHASRPVQCRLRVRQVAGNHLHGGKGGRERAIDPAWAVRRSLDLYFRDVLLFPRLTVRDLTVRSTCTVLYQPKY